MPDKVNREGKRFTFVRYDRTEDIERILSELKGYCIGDVKIMANYARFERNDEEKFQQSASKTVWRIPVREKNYEMSYADSVRIGQVTTKEFKVAEVGEPSSKQGINGRVSTRAGLTQAKKLVNSDVTMGKSAVFVPEKYSIAWAKNLLICGLKDGVNASDAVELLQSKNYCSTRICQLSTDLWILDALSKKERDQILAEDQDWLKLAFTFVRPWREFDVKNKR